MRVLVACPHPLSERMSGSNLRSLEIARQLVMHFDVTVGAPEINIAASAFPFRMQALRRDQYVRQVQAYDAVISNGTCIPARVLSQSGAKPLWITDLYNPFLFETLCSGPEQTQRLWPRVRHLHHLYRYLLRRSDLILCSSPQQQDFWIGGLHAAGGIVPDHRRGIVAADDLVRVVPFGIPDDPAVKRQSVLKGIHPKIADNDKVVLWGGGIWNWLDPLTLIDAMRLLKESRPDIKLVFMGAHLPQDQDAAQSMAHRARERAVQNGLLDSTVFFNDQWVPYETRADYLCEADLAVCLAPEGLENTYSYRTRLTDAIWAALPVVCTRHGFVADWIESRRGGLVVAGGNSAAAADAIQRALEAAVNEEFRTNLVKHQHELRWSRCVEPLVEFLKEAESGGIPPRKKGVLALLVYMAYKFSTLVKI